MENESPILYYVDKEYLKYLHKEDYRVSVKFNNRPFAGIVTLVGDRNKSGRLRKTGCRSGQDRDRTD